MKVSNKLWGAFIDLKSKIDLRSEWADFVFNQDFGFSFLKKREYDINTIFIKKGQESIDDFLIEKLFGDIYIYIRSDQNAKIISILKLYLPLILGKFIKEKYPFVIIHMAQTIDGKICTNAGKSKWIGNQENLIHAHRVRALVDGVLVGGGTVTKDLPRLDVRHVKGNNPARIFLTNTFNEWEKIPEVINTQVILIRDYTVGPSCDHKIVDKTISFDSKQDNYLKGILMDLKGMGMHSIMVEGGPQTVGSFILCKRADMVQFHIAAMIFGSGKSSVTLPEIEEVDDGFSLKNMVFTPFSNAIMITGELER